MKEFIEKLIVRLEEESYTIHLDGFISSTEKKIVEFTDVQKIVNQLTEEYKGEELEKSQKIYNFIKREINPYGKPFEGTVYEFGLKVMKYIKNIHTEELAEEYKEECEYKENFVSSGSVYFLTGCGTRHNGFLNKNRPYCGFCGKKIRVAPYQPKGE